MVTAWRRRRRRWRLVSLLDVSLLQRPTPVAVACRTRRVVVRPALMTLVVLFIMTGMCHVVADDDVALLWWRHIRAMVSLVVFLTSGGSERWRWTARLGSFSVVGRYGKSILHVACIPPSSF